MIVVACSLDVILHALAPDGQLYTQWPDGSQRRQGEEKFPTK